VNHFYQSYQKIGKLVACLIDCSDPILVSVDREVFEAYCFSPDKQSWGHSQASLDLKLAVKYPNLVNEAWVKLQYGLILWKMASYCRAYPQMIDSYWTVEMIKKQLLFKFIYFTNTD
jgi:hypothetical protein